MRIEFSKRRAVTIVGFVLFSSSIVYGVHDGNLLEIFGGAFGDTALFLTPFIAQGYTALQRPRQEQVVLRRHRRHRRSKTL